MTPLASLIARRIAASGPMTVADYMAECLLHPTHGYYTTQPPFGEQGDFTTAPEISQMFGELLGLCLAQSWLDQGSPPRIVLAELGPGRGTLLADALRATRGVAGFHAALSLHLVEASVKLREVQRATLSPRTAVWHDGPASLPQLPLFLIANEFFDALPIRQFRRVAEGWREHLVGLGNGSLALGLSDLTNPAFLRHRLQDTAPGQVVEVRPAITPVIDEIASRIAVHGGAALIIDYGNWRSRGDTWQALRHHAATDPLAEPGLADLTAHVDFEALSLAAGGVARSPMTPQGILLERLGITARAETLARSLSGPALQSHMAAHRRLTHPAEMGHLFQALALYPEGSPIPPGFDA